MEARANLQTVMPAVVTAVMTRMKAAETGIPRMTARIKAEKGAAMSMVIGTCQLKRLERIGSANTPS